MKNSFDLVDFIVLAGIFALAAIVAGLLYWAGILHFENDKWTGPYTECIHQTTTSSFIFTGKIMIPVTNTYCDQQSKEIYIRHGRSKYRLVPTN